MKTVTFPYVVVKKSHTDSTNDIRYIRIQTWDQSTPNVVAIKCNYAEDYFWILPEANKKGSPLSNFLPFTRQTAEMANTCGFCMVQSEPNADFNLTFDK